MAADRSKPHLFLFFPSLKVCLPSRTAASRGIGAIAPSQTVLQILPRQSEKAKGSTSTKLFALLSAVKREPGGEAGQPVTEDWTAGIVPGSRVNTTMTREARLHLQALPFSHNRAVFLSATLPHPALFPC